MSNNRSDYTKPFFDINNAVPSYLRNELSVSLFENVHNRFLTKNETIVQQGYIGGKNSNTTNRLPENTDFKQLNQLQPLVALDIDSKTDLFGWQDVLNTIDKLGIDSESFNDWGATKQFNFAPPVSIDKIVNYRDYYWIDHLTIPEYITIQNFERVLSNRIKLLNQSLTAIDQLDVDSKDLILYNINVASTLYDIVTNSFVGWGSQNFDDNGYLTIYVTHTTNTVDLLYPLKDDMIILVNDVVTTPASIDGSIVKFTDKIPAGCKVSVDLPWFYGINPGITPPVDQYGWFNLNDGLLYRFSTQQQQWIVVDPQPTGSINFDHAINRLSSVKQWSSTNKWIHKQFITDFSDTTQANMPIIEYKYGVQLNEYMRIKYNWKYRANLNEQFQQVDFSPTNSELVDRFSVINANPISDQYFVIKGNKRDIFKHGLKISIENIDAPYQAFQNVVQESIFDGTNTKIYLVQPSSSTTPDNCCLIPFGITSRGDRYMGFFQHWVLDSINSPVSSDISQVYSPSIKQKSFVVSEHTIPSIMATYDKTNNIWITQKLITEFETDDICYITNQRLIFNKISSYTFELFEDDGSLFVGDGTVIIFSAKYVLPLQMKFVGGSNNLRVYVNQIRQYDNYSECRSFNGQSVEVPYLEYGDCIVFQSNFPKRGDIVYIESHVVDASDIGLDLIKVRRSEQDNFSIESRSLVKYYRHEQVKTHSNQYPLFDLYDHMGNHTESVSSLWTYQEDQSFPINKNIQKRIKTSDQRKTYYFTNHLTDKQQKIFGYKLQDGYNVNLKTIWQYSKMYVPKKVDVNNQIDNNGSWEIPDPLMYNACHEIQQNYSTIDLSQHFRSLLSNQKLLRSVKLNASLNNIDGIIDFDYSLGGTIKEHNNQYDQWISSLYATKVATIDVIDFAKHQYNELINNIKQYIFTRYIELSKQSLNSYDKRNDIEQYIISQFTHGNWCNRIYGDSNSYNGQYGLKNFISTASMLGLWYPHRPYVIRDKKLSINKVITHIGGSVDVKLTPSQQTIIIDGLISNGNVINSSYNPTITDSNVRPGCYWYNDIEQQMYIFVIDYILDKHPLDPIDGQLWFNPVEQKTYKFISGSWVYQQYFTNFFIKFDFEQTLLSILLTFENKLYQISVENNKNTELKYDFNRIVDTNKKINQYNNYLAECFYQYCQTSNLIYSKNIDFKIDNPFTWNYRYANTEYVVYPNSKTPPLVGSTSGIYQSIFGTDVPHLEPWKLQGYVNKPYWWNNLYSDPNKRWNSLMWDNILNGIVPVGYEYHNGQISDGQFNSQYITKYSFVPVNITDTYIAGFYPGDLYPVYSGDPIISQSTLIRSQHGLNMSLINMDWIYGDLSPVELQWRKSNDYIYDKLIIAARIDPIVFFNKTSGRITTEIDQLNVDVATGQVCNHKHMSFHGQFVPESDKPVQYNGINQWYSNYFRYHEIDITISNLIDRWTKWNIVAGYLTDTMIEHDSLSIYDHQHKFSPTDYRVILKNSSGLSAIDIDNIIVTTAKPGKYTITDTAKIPVDMGDDWMFSVFNSSPIPKLIKYYPVKKYTASYVGNNSFIVHGNLPHKMKTGDEVRMVSTKTLPAPLNSIDTFNIIVDNSHSFRISSNQINAKNGHQINIITENTDPFTIGVVNTNIESNVGNWSIYQIDYSNLLTISLPTNILGVQSVIDFITGYSGYLDTQGISYSSELSINYDDVNSIRLDWESEIKRFISKVYNGLGTSFVKNISPDYIELNPFKYQCIIAPTTGVIGDVFNRGHKYLRTDPLIYDQYGKLMNRDQAFVFRRDSQTMIKLDQNTMPQTHEWSTHIAGMRLLCDYYQHAIIFDGYNGKLVYNSHLGVMVNELFVSMSRNNKITGRPNVGGSFLSQDKLVDNFDKLTERLTSAYDCHSQNHYSEYEQYARAIVGYQSPDFLNGLQISDNSKFNFWRGMIQAKGSKRAIDAMKNSKQLASISIDEFWAYRKAKFGSRNSIKINIDLKISIDDIKRDRLRCYFPYNQNVNKPLPYIRVDNTTHGRYVNYGSVSSTLQKMQNLHFNVKLNDVTDKLTTIRNQKQLDGSLKDVTFVHTDIPYDGFVVIVNCPNRVIGHYDKQLSLTFDQQFVDIIVSLTAEYISNCNNISVTVNGKIAIKDVDYFEVTPSKISVRYNKMKVSSITVIENVTIIVVQHPTVLIPSDSTNIRDYTTWSSKLCQIHPVIDNYSYSVYGLTPDYNNSRSIEIVDYESNAVVDTLSIYAPHHRQFSTAVMLNSDGFSNTDPAKYNTRLDDQNVNNIDRWDNNQVGTVWIDDSKLIYKNVCFNNSTDIDQQLDNLGMLMDASTVEGYIWVKSPVPPSEWSSYVSEFEDPEGITPVKPVGQIITKKYIRTRTDPLANFSEWREIPNEKIYSTSFVSGSTDLSSLLLKLPFEDVTSDDQVEYYIDDKFQRILSIDDNCNVILDNVPSNIYSTLTFVVINRDLREFDQLSEQFDNTNSSQNLYSEYKLDTPYTVVTEYIGTGEFAQPTLVYYFWVKNSNNIVNYTGLSLVQLVNHIRKYEQPLFTPCLLNYDPNYNELIKFRYSGLAISNIKHVITSDNRYGIRVKIEDSIISNPRYQSDVYYEWEMFRLNQEYNIPQTLWNKIIEAAIEYDGTHHLPSLDYVIYDKIHGTTTKYGFRPGQIIGDKSNILDIVTKIINDPNINLYPIERNDFLKNNTFDTNENIKRSLILIYNSFPYHVINKIAFEILYDFISIVPDSLDVIKTSWLSVTGNIEVEI